MASILDKYGIKEVADVTFYKINSDGTAGQPVLYLDTLKVSTVEQTAENVEAKGGKGNASLISWDYGKEINVTLEDALFSAKSMAIMFGNGTVDASTTQLKKTIEWTATSSADTDTTAGRPTIFEVNGKKYAVDTASLVNYDATGVSLASGFVKGSKYFSTFNVGIVNAGVIDVSANSFPGTYYVTGDTFARSATTGEDEFFQFIIPKAKVASENTITLEAEGDPSTFNMSLRVLRPDDGKMMKLVKYDLSGEIVG